MNDLFKPLYKQHRRASFASVQEQAFDPLSQQDKARVKVRGYTLARTGERWTCEQLPGLCIIAGALDADAQAQYVRESVVDYVATSEHLTNLDAHFASLPRPLRLFGVEPSILPDGKQHTVAQKLRWVTLGGQYNWTTKEYPSFEPGTPGCPHFPASLGAYIKNGFGVNAEAAIVNYYSEGDILSPHQDVAELSHHDLVSISLGCACVFYIGLDRYDTEPLAVILRSGDVVVMGGASRYAFHGVGRVFADTSPEALYSGMNLGDGFEDWMRTHRININVRQMR